MTYMQAIYTVALSIIVPFLVQLVKTEQTSATAARWIAIAASVAAGVVTGFAGGIPADPSAWVAAIFATIGGIQTAYSLFKAVGVTDGWLDALLGIGRVSKADDDE